MAPELAVRSGNVSLTEKLEGITILSLKRDADVIRNKGTLPTDWKNGLIRYATVKGGNASMKHV